MTEMIESDDERVTRRRRRVTFDRVADLYEETRGGYPVQAVKFVVETAGITDDSAVLEIACGTGQLTRQLMPYGVRLTAIDIAPAMVERAMQAVSGVNVSFAVTSFEDLDAPDDSFDLVISATAWHWIDPEVAYAKAARLLRSGGWLAVMGTGEVYDDPFGSRLKDLWLTLSESGSITRRTSTPPNAPPGRERFGPDLTRSYQERLIATAKRINGLERTRATSLDYDPERADRFDRGLVELLAEFPTVELTQHTSLTMMQLLE